jgi:hypothetical protein
MRILVVVFVLSAVAIASATSAPTVVSVYDPTGQSPQQIAWPPYPAEPPAGFHWQHSGSPAIRLDPSTGQPLPGQFTGGWLLVRDGYTMPKILRSGPAR